MSSTTKFLEEISERLLRLEDRFPVEIIHQTTADSRETPIPLRNPFQFDISGFRPQGRVDIERFFEIACEVVEDAQVRDGIVEDQRVGVFADFPDELMRRNGSECITYKIRSRKPANMNSDGSGRPQLGSMYSYEIESPLYPNKKIIVEDQPIDHVVEFSCWARTATVANKRALWLERLLKWHKWNFLIQGVDRFIWRGRGADTLWSPHSQRVHQRPLEFQVRLREGEAKAHPILRQIAIEILTETGS